MIQRLSELKNPSRESILLIRRVAEKMQPDDKKLHDWYNNSYMRYHIARLAFDADYTKMFLPCSANILEIGSIPLILTVALQEYGYNVKGVDIAPERFSSTIKKHKLEVKKVNIELETLPYPDDTFDAVIFNEIFEHLRLNPIFTMKEILRVLKKDGKLFLSTPNLKSIDGIINFLFGNIAYSCVNDIYTEYSKLEDRGHMGHVREYTIREVSTFLENVGFSIQTIIFRAKAHSPLRIKAILTILCPSLRPFFTIIAKK